MNLTETKAQYELTFQQFKEKEDLAGMVQSWARMVDILWAEWEDCTQLDDWIDELNNLRQLINAQKRQDLLPHLAKGAFAALSIRRMEHPDFAFWERINLQSLEGKLPIEERLIRSLQCMIHYTWGVGDQPRASLVLDYINIIFRHDNSSGMVQCIYHVCSATYQYWFDPDPQACPATVNEGLALSKTLALPHWDVPMLNVALFHACSGEQYKLATAYLEALGERLDEHSRTHDYAIYYHFKAYLAWLDGNHDAALFAAEKALDIATKTGFSFSPVYYTLAVAQILASLGRHAEALRYVGKCRKTAHRYKSSNIGCMAYIIGASIALNANRPWMAKRYLRVAADLGPARQYQRLPWVRQRDMECLSQLQVASDIDGNALSNLFNPPVNSVKREKCRVTTLGKLKIKTNTGHTPSSRKLPKIPLTLLLHLVAAGKDGLNRSELVERIWPDTDEEKGNHRLKTTLYRLRGLLGGDSAIKQYQGVLSLDPEYCLVDSWEFEKQCEAARSGNMHNAVSAVALFRGTFDDGLADSGSLRCYRIHLERAYAELVPLLAAHYQTNAQPAKALELYRKALDLDPLNDDFCINLIKLLDEFGYKAEIQKTLIRCRASRMSELSLDLPAPVLKYCREFVAKNRRHDDDNT